MLRLLSLLLLRLPILCLQQQQRRQRQRVICDDEHLSETRIRAPRKAQITTRDRPELHIVSVDSQQFIHSNQAWEASLWRRRFSPSQRKYLEAAGATDSVIQRWKNVEGDYPASQSPKAQRPAPELSLRLVFALPTP